MVVLPARVKQQRYDGHGGRWDYSRVPQTFSPLRSWLGLMKRKGRQMDSEHEEYVDLLITRNAALEEAVSLRLSTAQCAQPSWSTQCPVFPKLQGLNELKTIRAFDEAVDKLSECQRGIREKQAWVMLMSLIIEFPLESETRSNSRIKAADDTYVGVWINGAEGAIVNWLLTKGAVPYVDLIASNLHWQLELLWAYPLSSLDGHVGTVESAVRALRVPPIAFNAASKDREDDDELWYDRALKRKLIFSNLPPLPPGSPITSEEFSRPIPSWPFGSHANDCWMSKPPSVWMYKSVEAPRGRAGETYRPPTPPLVDDRMEVDCETADASSIRPPTALRSYDGNELQGSLPTTSFQSSISRPASRSSSVVSLGEELSNEEIQVDQMPDLFAPGMDVEMASSSRAGIKVEPEIERPRSPFRDVQGHSVTRYVRLRGMGFSSSMGDLRWRFVDLNRRGATLQVRGIYRVNLPSFDVDYLLEMEDDEDAGQGGAQRRYRRSEGIELRCSVEIRLRWTSMSGPSIAAPPQEMSDLGRRREDRKAHAPNASRQGLLNALAHHPPRPLHLKGQHTRDLRNGESPIEDGERGDLETKCPAVHLGLYQRQLQVGEPVDLLQRLDVRLEERVSEITRPPAKKRKHNRAGKRKAWMARMEERQEPALEVFNKLEEWEVNLPFVWRDKDVDWFIDMEEGDPDPFVDE
ncbi:hypothetical protein K438DRAFT_1784081 [Mycena galopus ATCC 62051]|nr:hypothetical protein K438DRAFT_1784081 [Mycena galopus ATCC 62051]